ncbi:MAG TPA: UDP-N-acetylglucosamine 2-epimerase (non-hydrolyzing) [Candidatus Acidoferrum sp.]|jgi:UDP-GlcNAc3NAcA epimerase|nr:UDP-N-acetylglucosamine 2-epimerase (non-hydrolyzing) [Candidatus Acidoferrum sp.]
MKVLTVIGARPQFIKASALSRELRKRHREILLHTGQHYDYTMSGVFFEGLGIPTPDINLNVGSGPHGAQTGAMLKGIEEALLRERPEWVIIYGDTNSTLAGALAAAKLEIPVAHVEAGLRSFNRSMPEEINRIVADQLSSLLLCPSRTAVQNLASEGISKNVHQVGDVMFDVLDGASEKAASTKQMLLKRLGVQEREYLLVTIHRSENTDHAERLSGILGALSALKEPVVFPIHPRARKAMARLNSPIGSNVRLIEPVGYVEMVALSKSARLILTDSGGLQKEAYWLGTPCVTLREETEWVETVEAGWNILVGAETSRIVGAVKSFSPPSARPALYGSGRAATQCVELLEQSSEPVNQANRFASPAALDASPVVGI